MIGMWKAFDEIERIGWVRPERRPRMVSVQAEGCAPIVTAYRQGDDRAQPWEGATTIADGLRVPRAIGDFLILRAVRESGGTALAVADSAMIEGMLELGRSEGVSAAPEGGAALAAVKRLLADSVIKPHDSVVLFNTGGALKYLDVLPPHTH
jgi:threonine synthase